MVVTLEQPVSPSSPPRRVPPTPPGSLIMGHLGDMSRDPVRFLVRMRQEYGDVVRVRFGPIRAHVLFHPDHVQHVLVRNVNNYSKDVRGYQLLRMLTGLGLLTGDGDLWRRQRRLAQPTFMARRVQVFAGVMTECAADVASDWRAAARAGQVVDVSGAMMAVALRIISRTMLGTDLSGEVAGLGAAITTTLEEIDHRIGHVIDLGRFVPFGRARRFRQALGMIDSVIERIIDARAAEHARNDRRPEEHDLLDGFMLARDEETGRGMSRKELLDEVKTIFLAGHETTANMLSWTWYLLSKHPEIARRLHEELDRALGDRLPTVEDIPRLPYLRQVLQESMRLLPPVWATERRAVAADNIDGYVIPPGEFIIVSQYVTHRHPDFWVNPEGFDPDRFHESRTDGMHKLQYFPFGAGPRICIGLHFAMLEGMLIMATLARRFRLDLVSGSDIQPEPVITLRPQTPIRMTIHERV